MTRLGAGALGVVLGIATLMVALAVGQEVDARHFEPTRSKKIADCVVGCHPHCPITIVDMRHHRVDCWCDRGVYPLATEAKP